MSVHVSGPGWDKTSSQTVSVSAPSPGAAQSIIYGLAPAVERMALDALAQVQDEILAAQNERDQAEGGPEWAEGLGDEEDEDDD